jgi:hypothetical protein
MGLKALTVGCRAVDGRVFIALDAAPLLLQLGWQVAPRHASYHFVLRLPFAALDRNRMLCDPVYTPTADFQSPHGQFYCWVYTLAPSEQALFFVRYLGPRLRVYSAQQVHAALLLFPPRVFCLIQPRCNFFSGALLFGPEAQQARVI